MELDRNAMQLPSVAMNNFPKARVGALVSTIRSVVANEYLLEAIAGKDEGAALRKIRESGNDDDTQAIQEMEAVLAGPYDYATVEAQYSEVCVNSKYPWYRMCLLEDAKKDTYEVMTLKRQHMTMKLPQWPRIKRHVSRNVSCFHFV